MKRGSLTEAHLPALSREFFQVSITPAILNINDIFKSLSDFTEIYNFDLGHVKKELEEDEDSEISDMSSLS